MDTFPEGRWIDPSRMGDVPPRDSRHPDPVAYFLGVDTMSQANNASGRVSDELAAAVERTASAIVAVHADYRLPSSG